MRAAQPHRRQFLVGALQVARIDEQEEVHPPADRLLAQELLLGRQHNVSHSALLPHSAGVG